MEKFFPPKPPIELILPAAVDKLLTMFERMTGTEALLSSALNKVNSGSANDDVPTH